MTVQHTRIDELSDLFGVEELPLPVAHPAPAPLALFARRPTTVHQVDTQVADVLVQELTARAAILIRGLNISGSVDAAQLADRVFAGHQPFSTGEHPEVDDHAGIYRPVRYSPSETLLWHHENSFNATWPRYLMFVCARPADEGGQTTIVDSRLVYEQMPAELRAPVARHGISYERLCDGRTSRSWQQIYETTDWNQARQQAEADGEELTFGDHSARIRAVRPAFLSVAHGVSWFNQILHWHPRALPDELREMVTARLVPSYRSCKTGDGTAISPDTVLRLVEAHCAVELAVRWAAGDVLLIDNTIIAHGRRPFRGPREHFVRMAGHGRHHRKAVYAGHPHGGETR
ncbi:MAG TPA: TauD/TfdA family dioxygenase [Nonomuraea sp.]|nr:TauD/TfdA family dioxygenase [Nonomuraea sp.]